MEGLEETLMKSLSTSAWREFCWNWRDLSPQSVLQPDDVPVWSLDTLMPCYSMIRTYGTELVAFSERNIRQHVMA
jgi:hypothetical protein